MISDGAGVESGPCCRLQILKILDARVWKGDD